MRRRTPDCIKERIVSLSRHTVRSQPPHGSYRRCWRRSKLTSRTEKYASVRPPRSRTIGAVRSCSRRSGSQRTLGWLKQDSNSHFLGRRDDQSVLAGVQK
jgi:hypothetical protein